MADSGSEALESFEMPTGLDARFEGDDADIKQ